MDDSINNTSGYEIFRAIPDASNSIDSSIVKYHDILQYSNSAITVRDLQTIPAIKQNFSSSNLTKEDEYYLLHFFCAICYGRLYPFWIPYYKAAGIIKRNIGYNDNFIIIDILSNFNDIRNVNDVYALVLTNGALVTFALSDIVITHFGYGLVLAQNVYFQEAITKESILSFCKMLFSRFTTDEINIAHTTQAISGTDLETAELTKEYPVLGNDVLPTLQYTFPFHTEESEEDIFIFPVKGEANTKGFLELIYPVYLG